MSIPSDILLQTGPDLLREVKSMTGMHPNRESWQGEDLMWRALAWLIATQIARMEEGGEKCKSE